VLCLQSVLAFKGACDPADQMELLVDESLGIAGAKDEDIDLWSPLPGGGQESTLRDDLVGLRQPFTQEVRPSLLPFITGRTGVFSRYSVDPLILRLHLGCVLVHERNQLMWSRFRLHGLVVLAAHTLALTTRPRRKDSCLLGGGAPRIAGLVRYSA
jgi:hypothetical protein